MFVNWCNFVKVGILQKALSSSNFILTKGLCKLAFPLALVNGRWISLLLYHALAETRLMNWDLSLLQFLLQRRNYLQGNCLLVLSCVAFYLFFFSIEIAPCLLIVSISKFTLKPSDKDFRLVVNAVFTVRMVLVIFGGFSQLFCGLPILPHPSDMRCLGRSGR